MKPIFCGNLEYDARPSELERLFKRYGKVERVDVKSGIFDISVERFCMYVYLQWLNLHTHFNRTIFCSF